jgi:hypothetical protein
MDLFTSEQLQALMVVAVITTFVVSALNLLKIELRGHWILAIVAFLVTLLKTTFTKGMTFADWQVVLTNFLLTAAFAILFWNYVGQYTVDPFFAWLKKKILQKYGDGGSESK